MTPRERPIIFSAPMVRAILDGSKTQTRRIVKWPAWAQPHPEVFARDLRDGQEVWYVPGGDQPSKVMRRPYGQPGDRLWVRETLDFDDARGHFYKATGTYVGPPLDYEREPSPQNGLPCRAIPSIHMPLWASRITLEVTGIRVERLQDISAADIVAEGACPPVGTPRAHGVVTEQFARIEWRRLWESINGPGSWEANPWVWVLEFKRC